MDIYEALQDKVVRVEAMRDNFPLFFAYHFWWEFKPFHIDWMESMQSDRNTFIEWFRASRKTTIAKGYIIRCICYKKRDYILRQSYEEPDSRSNVTDIAKMLFTPSIVEDYGKLFPLEAKMEDFSKKTQGNFDTTNKVRVQAKWLMQSTRWLNTFDSAKGQTERPDLLIIDDVDVVKSVMNPEIINQNERKLLWELFGALDPLDHKILLLGNTILEDGIVPRLRRLYENNDWRDVFRQPLFVNNENIRPEVFTDEVIKDAQGNGKIAYQQNYLLIPASSGTGIFVREYFDYFLTSHFENVDSPLQKQDIRRWIFIDPAFSTSNKSDDAVVIIIWEHRISKQYYLLDWYGGTSAPSSTRSHIISMYHKATLWGYRIELIHCEDVKINKDQTKFIEDLRAELLENHISIPLYTSTPTKQKNQRIVDTLEPVFSMKWVKFNRWLNDEFVQKLERQLLQHPNSDHDDHSDCLAQWIWYFRKAPEKKPTQRNLAISAITNRPIIQPTNRKNLQWVRWYSWINGRPL